MADTTQPAAESVLIDVLYALLDTEATCSMLKGVPENYRTSLVHSLNASINFAFALLNKTHDESAAEEEDNVVVFPRLRVR